MVPARPSVSSPRGSRGYAPLCRRSALPWRNSANTEKLRKINASVQSRPLDTRQSRESAPLHVAENACNFSGLKIRTKSPQSTGPERNRGERADFGFPGGSPVHRSPPKTAGILGFSGLVGRTENGIRRAVGGGREARAQNSLDGGRRQFLANSGG